MHTNFCYVPPLSPWQESIPPLARPAHIISELIELYEFLHAAFVIPGTSTLCKTDGDPPPLLKVPQPLTVNVLPAKKSPPKLVGGKQAGDARIPI